MSTKFPLAFNELERITTLSEYDLDYSNLQSNFSDLTQLAAKISGSEVSLINLIDSFTQWTLSSEGILIDQMAREDSVCQYTIQEDEFFEVPDLTADDRFKDKFYVASGPELKYYYGIPLKSGSGTNIGALCVMEKKTLSLPEEKIELLKLIAEGVVNRLKALKTIAELHQDVKDAKETRKRLAHDVRGPLAGIIGLTELITDPSEDLSTEEIMEYVQLINKSSASIIDLANEILTAETKLSQAPKLGVDEYNQIILKDKLIQLYLPQALNKNLEFKVNTYADTELVPFSKNKVLQITGNLISNAIKFTPAEGKVTVDLQIKIGTHSNDLIIKVIDTGVGIAPAEIEVLLKGGGITTDGTQGELGFGFGLPMVKHFVENIGGTFDILSTPGVETIFEIHLPQFQQ